MQLAQKLTIIKKLFQILLKCQKRLLKMKCKEMDLKLAKLKSPQCFSYLEKFGIIGKLGKSQMNTQLNDDFLIDLN